MASHIAKVLSKEDPLYLIQNISEETEHAQTIIFLGRYLKAAEGQHKCNFIFTNYIWTVRGLFFISRISLVSGPIYCLTKRNTEVTQKFCEVLFSTANEKHLSLVILKKNRIKVTSIEVPISSKFLFCFITWIGSRARSDWSKTYVLSEYET